MISENFIQMNPPIQIESLKQPEYPKISESPNQIEPKIKIELPKKPESPKQTNSPIQFSSIKKPETIIGMKNNLQPSSYPLLKIQEIYKNSKPFHNFTEKQSTHSDFAT